MLARFTRQACLQQSKPALSAKFESIKSIVYKILLASLYLRRFYADTLRSPAPNSNESKNLAREIRKNADVNIPAPPNFKTCTPIKVAELLSEIMRGYERS